MSASAAEIVSAPALPRLGFVGVGWIGASRLRSVVESACAQIVAIADVRAESAQQVALSISGPTAHPRVCSYEQLLESDLDGVVIATPNAEHAPQALAALERGLSVFCQKPLARTSQEAARVIQCAREQNRLLDVDFCYRNVAGVRELKTLIQSGAIGDVYAADLTFHNAYGPDKPWFFDARSVGGGCVMDLGIHLVDLLLWALEYPELESVASRLYRDGKLLSTPVQELENYATAELRFRRGTTARIACSWHLPAGRDAVIDATFYGPKGALRLRNVGGSFYDFAVERYEGTQCRALSTPSREWGAVAICDWVKRVGIDPQFDASVERIEDVHQILDAIYGR
jgi:predicted dehydrogenase